MQNEEGGGWSLEAGNAPVQASNLEPLASATVSDLTERELIARIHRALPPAPDWMLVGVGDDAAVVEPERNRVEVLSVDTLVEGVHFERAFVPPDAIGHRALAVNLSDLAAMGAAPRLALVAMALPASLPLDDFDAIVRGLTSLAARHRLHIAGGNLTRSPGPMVIDVTVVGTVKRRQALTRSGARVGDDVYVSGTIGAAAAGLGILRARCSPKSQVASPKSSQSVTSRESATRPETSDSADSNDLGLATRDLGLVQVYLYPQPRVRLGMLLARNRAASACMDLSDGLADGVHQIAEASGVGIAIDAGALPIDPCAGSFFEAAGRDPVTEAITGGDDYELLLAVRPRARRRLAAIGRQSGVPLTRIGSCTADRAVTVRRAGREAEPLPPGYSHFR